jgi:hypothetical protein
MRIDVLDHHRSVIHEDAHREREAAQSHDIDGLPGPGEPHDGAEDRERDRSTDDQGRASGAQEQQDDQAGQHGGYHHFLHDVFHRSPNESRGIVERCDLHAGRQGLQNLGYFCFDTRDHGERRGISGFEHFQQHGLVPADQYGVGLRRSAEVHMGDIADGHHREACLLDRQ